jgi:hypothetical protein
VTRSLSRQPSEHVRVMLRGEHSEASVCVNYFSKKPCFGSFWVISAEFTGSAPLRDENLIDAEC